MRSELSMASRVEITSRYAKAYGKAGKKGKGLVLDEVVSVTGWSRDNARRRLVAAARPPGAGRQVAWVSLFPAAYRDAAIFGIIILLLVLKPEGLFGHVDQRRDAD
jgi:hypothetical protein